MLAMSDLPRQPTANSIRWRENVSSNRSIPDEKGIPLLQRITGAGHRASIVGLSLALLGCVAASGCRPAAEPPNIVLLIVDTLRADKLGCYGHPADASPEIDALAEQGVIFENVFAQSSWTRPSIGSLLTGRYPRSLGIYTEKNGILPDPFPTLAELLNESGYTTIGITANPHLNRAFNFHQGFDHYFDSSVVYSFMKTRPGETQFRTSRVVPAPEMFDTVLRTIKSAPEGPYYVQIDVMEVHEWSRGGRTLLRMPFAAQFGGQPNRMYMQAIRQTSHDVAAFFEQLRALPGWEDTLFVITSDHGEGLDDHPRVARSKYHGHLLYESQLRVPLVLYRPGWKWAGRRIARPVRLLDVMPTLLDSAGIDVPDGLEGVSLWPLLRDPDADIALPGYFVAETQLRSSDKASVYSGDWKYIESYKPHKGTSLRELQRMGRKEDGRKTNELAVNPDVAELLAAYLESWKKDHPRAASTQLRKPISPEETEQLKALGYLQ